MDGFRVDPEELARLAVVFRTAADALLGQAVGTAAIGADPGVLGSGLLAPGGLVGLDLALGRAGDSLLRLARRLEVDALRLQATRVRYELVDSALARDAMSALADRKAWPGAAHHSPRASLTRFAEGALTGVAAPLIDGPVATVLAELPRPLLSLLSRDGPGGAVEVTLPDIEAAGPEPAATPRSVADSLQRIGAMPAPAVAGRTDVIALTALGGDPPCYRLELPGMARLGPAADPMTLTGAVAAELGRASAYSRGVQAAVDLAGVPVGARLLLVGHSEGGIAAMNLAGDRTFSAGRVQVTHVVAAGSPIGAKQLPPGSATALLSLENIHDVVPGFDGVPVSRGGADGGRLTYTFSHDTGSVLANHSAEMYAGQVRHALLDSPSPAARAFLDGLAPYYGDPVGPTRYFALTERRT